LKAPAKNSHLPAYVWLLSFLGPEFDFSAA
jgi:hypothetical protein